MNRLLVPIFSLTLLMVGHSAFAQSDEIEGVNKFRTAAATTRVPAANTKATQQIACKDVPCRRKYLVLQSQSEVRL